MSTQPEALRLADILEKMPLGECDHQAAAELRRLLAENERLHQINQSHEMKLSVRGYEIQIADLEAHRDALRAELKEATEAINDPAVNNLRTLPESIRVLCAQRDALLEALKAFANEIVPNNPNDPIWVNARAAIKSVEEGE